MRRPVAVEWRLFPPGSITQRSVIAGITVAMLTCIAGCGWIFGKQQKPMHVDVELASTPDLNFDGKNPQSIRVKVLLLRSSARFMAADPNVFFDPTWSDQLEALYAKDGLDSGSVILAPQETALLELEVRSDKAESAKPVLCAIADFYRSPGPANERVVLNIPKKTSQKVKLQVGKDWVKKAGK